jgi:hypothetical protein
VRFKDLLGRTSKTEQEPTGGRLITPAAGPAPPAPPAAPERPRPATPAAPETPPVAPSGPNLPVADRFAILLAVEQGEAVMPTETPEPPPGDRHALTDAEIDRLAVRVAERLAAAPLAADVQRIVAEVSERLVKEEIERIRKAAESRLS